MRYLLALVVFALCFCSTSPTSSTKTDPVKQPFEVCLSGWNGGWVDVYPYDSLNRVHPVKQKLTTVLNDNCETLNLPDGSVVVAYYLYQGAAMSSATRSATYMVHAGDYWNL